MEALFQEGPEDYTIGGVYGLSLRCFYIYVLLYANFFNFLKDKFVVYNIKLKFTNSLKEYRLLIHLLSNVIENYVHNIIIMSL